jgi:PAS domain S-box-containing protein
MAARDPQTAPYLEPVSILLVDDRPENLVALKAILSAPEHRLVTATSGEEALKVLLLVENFALILLDVLMPGMDGFEVAHSVRLSERTKHIPIIFVTAVATDARQVAAAYSLGAVDYLIKPLDRDIVRAKVAVFVDLYRQRERVARRVASLPERERRDYQVRLEELRVASERRYRRLVEGIDHVIGWSARADTISVSFVSRRAQRLLGYSPLELVAPDFWAKHVHPDDRARLLETFRAAIEERRDTECVHRLRAAHGREVWLRTSVSAEPTEAGGGIELRGTSVDITDLVAEMDQAIDGLRHPLNAIARNAATLAQQAPTGAAREQAELIERAAADIGRLLQDLRSARLK